METVVPIWSLSPGLSCPVKPVYWGYVYITHANLLFANQTRLKEKMFSYFPIVLVTFKKISGHDGRDTVSHFLLQIVWMLNYASEQKWLTSTESANLHECCLWVYLSSSSGHNLPVLMMTLSTWDLQQTHSQWHLLSVIVLLSYRAECTFLLLWIRFSDSLVPRFG